MLQHTNTHADTHLEYFRKILSLKMCCVVPLISCMFSPLPVSFSSESHSFLSFPDNYRKHSIANLYFEFIYFFFIFSPLHWFRWPICWECVIDLFIFPLCKCHGNDWYRHFYTNKSTYILPRANASYALRYVCWFVECGHYFLCSFDERTSTWFTWNWNVVQGSNVYAQRIQALPHAIRL